MGDCPGPNMVFAAFFRSLVLPVTPLDNRFVPGYSSSKQLTFEEFFMSFGIAKNLVLLVLVLVLRPEAVRS
jgi:hypothetical protein